MTDEQREQVFAVLRAQRSLTLEELVAAVPGLHFGSVAWLIKHGYLEMDDDEQITLPHEPEPGSPKYLQWMRRVAREALAGRESGQTTDALSTAAGRLANTLARNEASNIEIEQGIENLLAQCEGNPRFAMVYLTSMLTQATRHNVRLREQLGQQ